MKTTNTGKDVEKPEPFYTTGKNVSGAVTMKKFWQFLKKVNIEVPCNSNSMSRYTFFRAYTKLNKSDREKAILYDLPYI